MLTINEAIEIVEKKEPNLLVCGGTETSEWFQFCMVTKDKRESIGNSCTYAVNKKSKECGWKPAFISGDDDYNYGIIDVYDENEIDKVRKHRIDH